MKKLLIALGLVVSVIAAYAGNENIAQLPLGSASTTGSADSYPFVSNATNATKRMTVWDIANIPSLVSMYAPIANPTFTTKVTTPALRLTTSATTGYCWVATNSSGDGSWQACTSGSGTVTSVGLTAPAWLTVGGSPITTSGTLALTGTSESANLVLASPDGTSGALSPRALVSGDIPNNAANTNGTAANVSGTVLVGHGGTGATSFTSGAPLVGNGSSAVSAGSKSGSTTTFGTTSGTLTSGDCAQFDASGNLVDAGAACSSSAISSITLTTPSWLTVSGSPLTSSGTLGITGTSETQNLFLASPNGSSGAMTPRSIVAADIPTLNQNTSGTAAGLSATLAVGSGGTGATTLSSGNPLFGAGTSPITAGTLSGNTTKLVTTTGSLTSGHCADFDASGNLVDAGATCGGSAVTSVAMTGDGTVFNSSVTGSPITSTGTLAPSLHTQSANTVFAGPTSGGATTPTFRALTGTDLPNPGASSLGGIQSTTGSTGNFISAISTSGIPTLTAALIPVQAQNGSANNATKIEVPNNQATLVATGAYLLETANKNLLSNGNFQASTVTSGWTTGGSGLAVTADTTNYLDLGPQSALLTFTSSTTGTFSQTITPTNIAQFSGVNMMAQAWVKTTLSTLQVCALVGGTTTNCQSVPSTGNWTPVVPSNFVGPASGSFGIEILTNGTSTTGTANVAFAYAGRAENVSSVSQAVSLGTSTWVQGTNVWSITSAATTYGTFPANASISAPTFSSGAVITAPATRIPAVVIPNAGPGTYRVVATGAFDGVSSGGNYVPYFTFYDGTNYGADNAGSYTGSASDAGTSIVESSFTYTAPQTNLTFTIAGRAQTATKTLDIGLAETSIDSMAISVYYFPSQAQQAASSAKPLAYAYATNTAGGSYTANAVFPFTSILGDNYGGFSSGTYTVKQAGNYQINGYIYQNSATAGIVCVQHNGTSTPGCNFAAAGHLTAPFGTSFTAAVGDTITAVVSQSSTIDASAPTEYFISIQQVVTTANAPILVGSVTSNSSGAERIERIHVIHTANSTCSIGSQSGSWMSSVSCSSAGVVTLNFTSGMFSAAPACTCVITGSDAYMCTTTTAPSTTGAVVNTDSYSSGTPTNEPFDMICMGPR